MLVELKSWNSNEDIINNIFSGRVITRVDGLYTDSDGVYFYFNENEYFKMYHDQDCCENVDLDDICGSTNLEGETFYEITKKTNNELEAKSEYDDSYTWTFYTIRTSKGYLDLRWYGNSNGYYSEDVDLQITYENGENDDN